MNKKIFAFLAAGLTLFACKEEIQEVIDPEISVSPASIEAEYTGGVRDIEVTANTGWVIERTDAGGNEISWVKLDRLNDKGSCSMQIKITENTGKEERIAVLKFVAGDAGEATAYIDIRQGVNPNPDPEPGPGEDPDPEPVPGEGYDFPMFQRFTTGLDVAGEGGSVKKYSVDELPIVDATVSGSKIVFKKGLEIEASSGSYTVARPAHTNPTKNAGFQEGFCLEGFETGTITYTIPLKESLSGKVRFFKGQRRETSDNYSWSSDGGVTFNEIGAATGGASDAFWKYIDFEIPASAAVPAGGKLIVKENVTYNASGTYGGIMMQCGVSLQASGGEKSTVPAMNDSEIAFSEGFDNIISAPAAQILDYGFMKSWTSGKYNAPSYTAEKVSDMPSEVSVEYCYSRPGFLQVGFADEAMAYNSKEYYLPGSYSINIGERLKAMGMTKADLTVTFRAAGLTTAFGENGNAEPVLSSTSGTVSDGGAVALIPDRWKDYSFTISGADQTAVLKIASNSTTAGALAGKSDNRFFIDDIVVKAKVATAQPLELSFDFTVEGLNWPPSKTTSWKAYKGYDSGLAVDNDGVANEANTHRRVTVGYPLNGKEYDFVLADPDGATAHNIYISAGKGIYVGTLRYVGLPVIDGMRLAQVVMVQNASTKDPATFTRNVGVCSNIVGADDEGVNYIPGGELQNQYTNMGEYTYDITESTPGTLYYLHSPNNASIVYSLKLKYIPVE
ncbi:MAG: BACON domain-containing protein [Candidatus Cryptobacteroides sp.]